MRTRINKAFTLIEILIVVVILGILAAIVIPQFTKASEDAQVSNIQSQLQTIRSQIELYRVRNNGAYPNLIGTGTSAFGPLVTLPNATVQYLRSIPVNPRNNSGDVAAGTSAPTAAIDPAGPGWIYDATTGNLWAAGFHEAAAGSTTPAGWN